MDPPSPARYSPTQKSEAIAISTLQNLLDKDRQDINKIVYSFNSQDKKPDIDGNIIILNENGAPLCTLEVQVKKIKDKDENNLKIQCPLSLFGYANGPTLNPVLLIGVNTHNNIAYWIHINRTLFDVVCARIKESQKTIVLNFDKSHIIDGVNRKYIEKWQEIYYHNQLKFTNYEILQAKFKSIEEAYSLLKQFSNPLIGTQQPELVFIHRYLDRLNYLLDTKYQIVKKIYFRDSWKVGLAYQNFTEESSTYSHYPIQYDMNDVQIKLIDDKWINKSNYDLISTSHHNPIIQDPTAHATKYIHEKVQTIVKNRLLDHRVNEKLSNEYVIAFLDKFHLQMGLEEKDVYTIEEIETGFFKYLPLWTDEAFQFIKTPHLLTGRGYHDPGSYIVYIPPKERDLIHQRVEKRLLEGDEIPSIRLGNREYPFGIFMQMFTYLKSINLNKVSRIYEKKDYFRHRDVSNSIFNVYSEKAFEDTLSIVLENIKEIYPSIVRRNFPFFAENSLLFQGANLIIVTFEFREICPPMGPFHSIRMYFLKSLIPNDTIIVDLFKQELIKKNPDFLGLNHKPYEIEYNENRYKLLINFGITDEIFSDTPCFDLLYKLLKFDLEQNTKRF
jgi:hypothetical protein